MVILKIIYMSKNNKLNRIPADMSYKKVSLTVRKRFTQNTIIESDYSSMSKEIKPTPEKLKRSMFKTASKGIVSALRKK